VKNEQLTGEGMPDYPPDDVVRNAAKASHPVTGLDAYAAEAFCAWQGKRLPSAEEWIKAARGGLTLDAAAKIANPLPRRNLPWGEGEPQGRTNLRDTGDAWVHSAPVTAFPSGASPYGVLALADNVSEWTSTTPEGTRPEALRVILGGAWDTELADGLHAISALNERSPRFFMFTIGLRCARSHVQ
jgi:formylglycine-generating enzyme required for sulfatase activity